MQTGIVLGHLGEKARPELVCGELVEGEITADGGEGFGVFGERRFVQKASLKNVRG